MCRSALLVIALVLGGAATAAANGRFPATSTLHFRPGSTDELYVGATWGLIYTQDNGATWRWVCEQAVGYGGDYDPDYAVTPIGTLLATTFNGLRTTRDGCVWTPTPLGMALVSSVTVGPDGVIWAAVADAGDSKIYRSADDGARFVATATTGADVAAWWESLEVAPSNKDRAYLAGYRIVDGKMNLLLLRTDNAGAAWKALSTASFATVDRSTLQLASISPDDPDFLLARITTRPDSSIGDAIYRSTNAGESWQLVKEFDDDAPGVVIRRLPAGGQDAKTTAEVVIGTRKSGTFHSTDGGVTYVPVPQSLQVGCMAERFEDRTLFACANNIAPDNMAIARGTTPFEWSAALEFRNVTAPAACGDDTVQRLVCQEQFWCGFKNQLSIASEVIDCPSAADATAPPPVKDGCGCDAGGGAGAAGTAMSFALLALGRRRRRRGRAPRRGLFSWGASQDVY